MVTFKENDNPWIMLEDPKDILGEPLLRLETPRNSKEATVIADRDLRDKQAGTEWYSRTKREEHENRELVTIFVAMKCKKARI